MAELVSSTTAGVGQVLLIEGEAGIGKTHLVREAIAQAGRVGIRVVEASGDELVPRPGAVPHGLLRSVRGGEFRARLDGLLNPPMTTVDTNEDRSYAVVEASVDLLESMAEQDRSSSLRRTSTGPTTCRWGCSRRSSGGSASLRSVWSGRSGRGLALQRSTACSSSFQGRAAIFFWTRSTRSMSML